MAYFANNVCIIKGESYRKGEKVYLRGTYYWNDAVGYFQMPIPPDRVERQYFEEVTEGQVNLLILAHEST